MFYRLADRLRDNDAGFMLVGPADYYNLIRIPPNQVRGWMRGGVGRHIVTQLEARPSWAVQGRRREMCTTSHVANASSHNAGQAIRSNVQQNHHQRS